MVVSAARSFDVVATCSPSPRAPVCACIPFDPGGSAEAPSLWYGTGLGCVLLLFAHFLLSDFSVVDLNMILQHSTLSPLFLSFRVLSFPIIVVLLVRVILIFADKHDDFFIRFSEVDVSATELVKSFSEDPKKTGIDDFMRELLEFVKRFDRAQRENTARELKVCM